MLIMSVAVVALVAAFAVFAVHNHRTAAAAAAAGLVLAGLVPVRGTVEAGAVEGAGEVVEHVRA